MRKRSGTARGFESPAAELRAAILRELEQPDLPSRRRVSFYGFGAGLALLLDQEGGAWKPRYRGERFSLERFAAP